MQAKQGLPTICTSYEISDKSDKKKTEGKDVQKRVN
jgi:hypothetical protein